MLKHLVHQLRTKGPYILAIAAVAFAINVLLLTFCAPQNMGPAFIFGLSRSAGLLMTLDSPNVLELQGSLRYVARCTCWIVSLSGWFLIPILISALVGEDQLKDDLLNKLRLALTNAFSEAGLDPESQKIKVRDAVEEIKKMRG